MCEIEVKTEAEEEWHIIFSSLNTVENRKERFSLTDVHQRSAQMLARGYI